MKAAVALPCETSNSGTEQLSLSPLGRSPCFPRYSLQWEMSDDGHSHQVGKTGPSGAAAGMASAWGGLTAGGSHAIANSLTWLVGRHLNSKQSGREEG